MMILILVSQRTGERPSGAPRGVNPDALGSVAAPIDAPVSPVWLWTETKENSVPPPPITPPASPRPRAIDAQEDRRAMDHENLRPLRHLPDGAARVVARGDASVVPQNASLPNG